MRVGADRDDVECRRLARRPEGLGSTPNGTNTTRGAEAVPGEPAPEFVRLVLAVGDHGGTGAERGRIETTHPVRAQLYKAFREPDRHVDERRPEAARTP